MISDHDREVLADIERHLRDDAGLCRAFGRNAGRASRIRRAWFTVLLAPLVLMVGMAALGASGAALEGAALAVAIGAALRFTSANDQRMGRGRIPSRRS